MARRQFDLAKNALMRKRHFGHRAGVLCAAFVVSGCVTGGLGIGTELDRGAVTGSITAVPSNLTDEDIIRQTVAEADISTGFIQHLPWANLTTGDGGVVSYVRENGKTTQVCREFIASKHSFDGVAQYFGEICRARLSRDWTLESMKKQD